MRVVNDSFAGLGLTAASYPRVPGAAWVGPVRMPFKPLIPTRGGGSHLPSNDLRTLFRENNVLDIRTCGQPGAPPCNTASAPSALQGWEPPRSLGSLGRITNIACSDHTTALDQLENLVGEANRVGMQGLELNQAVTYLDRFSGISWQHPAWPSTCDREVANARAIYNALATRLKAQGAATGANLFGPDDLVPPARPDITGTIKTVAIVAGVIAGVVLLFPIVRAVVKGGR
mgnify:FL=1